jgi:hypothetical protein
MRLQFSHSMLAVCQMLFVVYFTTLFQKLKLYRVE